MIASHYKAILSQYATIRPPKNAFRHLYAQRIFRQAILFLLGHEIAHITLGHVDYYMDRYGVCSIAESGKPSTAAIEAVAREWQSIELDADRRSIRARIFSAHKSWKEAKQQGVDLAAIRYEPEQLIFDVGCAINLFFRMFGDQPISLDEQRQKIHPSNATRRTLAIGLASQAVGEFWGPEYMPMSAERFAASLLAVEDAFEGVAGELPVQRSLSGLAQATSDAGLAASFDLVDYLDGPVREKLKRYAYEK